MLEFQSIKMSTPYKFLLFSSLIATFADSLFGPLYAIYVQGIGGDLLDVGNSIAVYSIATGVLIIVTGKISDKINKALLTTAGFTISAFATLAYLVIKTPVELYILQLVFALSTALLSAPFSALFAQHIKEEQAGLMWAFDAGGGKILTGIGISIGTFITHAFGFVAVFFAIFFLQACAAISQVVLYVKSEKTI